MPHPAPVGGGPASTTAAGVAQRELEAKRRRKAMLLRDFYTAAVTGSRYRVDKVIGEGAYGVVVAATDTHTGERVAVKRIKRVLDTAGMATRILRELKFLRFLHTHENIISVKDIMIPGERDRFNDVFVVFEIMPTDLRRLLRSRTVLTEDHYRFMLFQLLRGINFMHNARVFHRDLNPNNILVNADCLLRICDFGLARASFQDDDNDLSDIWTDYVVTRWYRAPELIIAQSTKYSTAIDMWSVGCIFAEMLGAGKPLFPGSNERDVLRLIINVTGPPSPATRAKVRIPDKLDRQLNALPAAPRTPLAALYPLASPPALDLLSRMLTFDPDERITAAQALAMPYFAEYRRYGLGVSRPPLDERDFAFERRRLSAADMRAELLREIAEYHPNEREALLSGGIMFQGRSPADRFGEDMLSVEANEHLKSKTVGSKVFSEINQDSKEFKNSSMGEAQLSMYAGGGGQAPAQQHHHHQMMDHQTPMQQQQPMHPQQQMHQAQQMQHQQMQHTVPPQYPHPGQPHPQAPAYAYPRPQH